MNKYLAVIGLCIPLIIHTIIYLYISKRMKTYFNFFTMDFSKAIVIQLLPFVLGIMNGTNKIESLESVLYFSFILSVAQIVKMCGYLAGSRTKIKQINLDFLSIKISKRMLTYIMFFSYLIMAVSFLMLASRGGGLAFWIFNNRNAYLSGRAGNGVFYILFQLFIIVSAVSTWMYYYYTKKGKGLLLFLIVCSYFTGSKSMIIGMVLLLLFFYDHVVKKINVKRIVLLGLLALIALNVLLYVQSGLTLFQYVSGDYYSNFLRLIHLRKNGGLDYTWGKLAFEDFFWMLIPRALYADKPFAYGSTRLAAMFYGEATVAAGNTPSFSEFAVPYVDFGIIGICLECVVLGFLYGYVESRIRALINREGISFVPLLVYALFIIISPINFVWVYKFIFIGILCIAIKMFKAKRRIAGT